MPSSPILRFIAAAVLAIAAAAAHAQLRTLPPDAKRGEIRHVEGMVVEINGSRAMLAPGAQIRNESNLIVLPAAVPAGATVRYTLDASGQVFRVWILTPQEAAQRDPR
jgi:hypothetical protein